MPVMTPLDIEESWTQHPHETEGFLSPNPVYGDK